MPFGSVTFWYRFGSADPCHWNYGPGSCSFSQCLSRMMSTISKFFFSKVFSFSFIIDRVHLHKFSKITKKSQKTTEIKGFLIFLDMDGRIRNRSRIRTNNYGSAWPKSLQRIKRRKSWRIGLFSFNFLKVKWRKILAFLGATAYIFSLRSKRKTEK